MTEVGNEGSANRLEERQNHFLATLLGADADFGVLPVEIV
jgi:hypothetical protein